MYQGPRRIKLGLSNVLLSLLECANLKSKRGVAYLSLMESGNDFHVRAFLTTSSRGKHPLAFGIGQQSVGIQKCISDHFRQGICIAFALQDADLQAFQAVMLEDPKRQDPHNSAGQSRAS